MRQDMKSSGWGCRPHHFVHKTGPGKPLLPGMHEDGEMMELQRAPWCNESKDTVNRPPENGFEIRVPAIRMIRARNHRK